MLRYDTMLASGLADLAMRLGVAATNIQLEGTFGSLEPIQDRVGLLQRGGIPYPELSQTVRGLKEGQDGIEETAAEALVTLEGRIWGALAAHDSLPEDQRERLSRLVAGEGDFSMLGVLEGHRWIRGNFIQGLLSPNEKLQSEIKLTPLFPFEKMARDLGRPVYIKFEGRQRSGSLKVRGSTYVLAAARILGRNPYQTRVVTASLGNHAVGLVTAAQNLGFQQIEIGLPKTVSAEREAKLRRMGAKVSRMGETLEQADEWMRFAVEDDPNVLYISRFDHPMFAMGLGTLGVEIDIQMARQKFRQYAVVAPAGTGGLLAGLGTYLQSENVPVFGIQSSHFDALSRSFSLKQRISSPPKPYQETAADSLAIHTVGKRTFDEILRTVQAMRTLPEAAITEAVAYMDDAGFVFEGAAALAAAAVLFGVFEEHLSPRMPVVLVHTGENIDQALYDDMVRRGHASQHMRRVNEHDRTTRPAPRPGCDIDGNPFLEMEDLPESGGSSEH